MKKKSLWTTLFIGPHMILFVVFFLIPAIFGIAIAFTEWDLFSTPVFVGFENFRKILFDTGSIYHEQFMIGIKNTLLFVIMVVPVCIIFPLFLAVLLSTKPVLNKLFQAVLYLPTLFAVSAVMIIWAFQLSLSFGPFKALFGLKINLVATQPWAWLAIIIVTLWWSAGSNMIIYVAALNSVPTEQLEAAKLDGAGRIKCFTSVVLPNIRYQLLFTTVMTTIAQFNIYGQPLMLTVGGPNNSTRVLMMYIQDNAFGRGSSSAGIASAMAVLLGLVIMVFSAIQFIISRRSDA